MQKHLGNSKETGETQHSENNRENHHDNHGNLSPRNKAAKCISAKLNSHENKILCIYKIKLYMKKDCKKNVFFKVQREIELNVEEEGWSSYFDNMAFLCNNCHCFSTFYFLFC